MSADNGIYIVATKDPSKEKEYEYRVKECQNIEDLYYGANPNIYYLWLYFHKGSIFNSNRDALIHAGELAEDCYILEYGIQKVGQFDFPFPTEEEAKKWEKAHANQPMLDKENDPTAPPRTLTR